MTTTAEINQELIRLSRKLDEAQAELVMQVHAYAEAEHEYRLARSTAYLSASGTVAEREAHVDQGTAAVRKKRDIAEGLKLSALESVRNGRQQLSALQTMAAAQKEEAKLARYGEGP